MAKNNAEKNIIKIGKEFGEGLRETSNYESTQEAFIAFGLIDAVLNKTPPVGLNLQILTEQMPNSIKKLTQSLPAQIESSLFGLAIIDGVDDLAKVLATVKSKPLNSLEEQLTINVVDIDQTIITELKEKQQPHIQPLLEDARNTSLNSESQDFIVRDHLGNCCPPGIYSDIETEVTRVLKKDGLSLVNITTSEKLLKSKERELISLEELTLLVEEKVIIALKERIFSLEQLTEEFPELNTQFLRGKLLEIMPDSFVIFGEDKVGHGEWFSSLEWHKNLWEKNNFTIVDQNKREGHDSHQPPLECVRHIVLLEKN